ncbi:MAG: hypothetical protein V7731_02215 [Amphritea sp.]
MQEQQRHQYLEAMGISSWLPRKHLAGAKPTPDWVWEFVYPEEDSSQAPVAERSQQQKQQQAVTPQVTAAAALQARTDLAASFSAPNPASAVRAEKVETAQEVAAPVLDRVERRADVEAQTPVDSVESAPEVVITSAAESTEQAPFKLAFMTYGDCLVVDSLPPRSRQGVSDQHQALLGKILQSVGLQGSAVGDLFMLPWPMFASKSLDQGADQARMTVQHKLTKSLQTTQVHYVLLLGEAAAQMVLERSEPLEQLRGLLFSLRSDVKTLASASLTEMISVPGCKRDVWMDLQPLLQHIENAQS